MTALILLSIPVVLVGVGFVLIWYGNKHPYE